MNEGSTMNDGRSHFSGTLDSAERAEFEPFVRELAAVSGAIIRRYYLEEAGVETKADDTPVTAADRRAEQVMRLLIEQRYPDHGILGEEFGGVRPDARYRWVLDPIDGTKAFVSNCFIFGTLISLVRDGRPIIGAIAHPMTGHVLVGFGGGATLLGDRPMRLRPCARLSESTVLATDHFQMLQRFGAPYEAVAREARLYRTWGDCHGYFQVATGGADAMFDPILKPWDICALVPVIEGAGGWASAIDGSDPVAGTDMIACAPALKDTLLERLKR
jgi:histidinol phosphatase-like enzyme (inositol monophosphatase family)